MTPLESPLFSTTIIILVNQYSKLGLDLFSFSKYHVYNNTWRKITVIKVINFIIPPITDQTKSISSVQNSFTLSSSAHPSPLNKQKLKLINQSFPNLHHITPNSHSKTFYHIHFSDLAQTLPHNYPHSNSRP